MKKKLLFVMAVLAITVSKAQNIFSGEPVQVVGQFNSYATTPYNSDYRTTSYVKMTTTSGNPTDGRGYWKTVINVQPTGGDVTPINMTGGGSNGFLFISGPSSNRFQNKWVFSGVGQGTVNGINTGLVFNSGNDMGLNMNTAGYYTFIFNDCGYTATNASYYVGRTTNAPVTVSRSSAQTFSDGTVKVNITTSATPSPEEKFYVRYKTGDGDFGTAIGFTLEATGTGTSYSATIPTLTPATNVYYYVFSSTRALADLNARGITAASSPLEVNLAAMSFDDNGGGSYSYNTSSILPLLLKSFTATNETNGTTINWETASELGNSSYELEKSNDGNSFTTLTNVTANPSKKYSYVDANNNGTAYYRLKLKEANGNFQYSKVLLVKQAAKNNVALASANPATIFTIKTNLSTVATVNIYSQSGALVQTKQLPKGASLHTIDLSAVAKGNYIMQLQTIDKSYKSSSVLVVQ